MAATAEKIGDILLDRIRSMEAFNVETYLQKMVTFKTNSEKVNWIYDDLKLFNLIPKFVADCKHDEISQKQRVEGNRLFEAGNHIKSLKSYSCSVATAKTKHVLALAYANRSALLFKMKMYRECLEVRSRFFLFHFFHNKVYVKKCRSNVATIASRFFLLAKKLHSRSIEWDTYNFVTYWNEIDCFKLLPATVMP